jgi:hypothetical protein
MKKIILNIILLFLFLFVFTIFLIKYKNFEIKFVPINSNTKTLELQSKIDSQKSTLNKLESSIIETRDSLNSMCILRTDYLKEVELLRAEKKGKIITYFIEIEIRYKHTSLNEVKMSIPVDREYYNQLEIGETLLNEFRGCSFLIEGSTGGWDVKVIRKWEIISDK